MFRKGKDIREAATKKIVEDYIEDEFQNSSVQGKYVTDNSSQTVNHKQQEFILFKCQIVTNAHYFLVIIT